MQQEQQGTGHTGSLVCVVGWWRLPAAGADQLPGWCVCTEVALGICSEKNFKTKPPCRLVVKSLHFDRSFVPATWGYQLCFLFVCCGVVQTFICVPTGIASAERHCGMSNAATATRHRSHRQPGVCSGLLVVGGCPPQAPTSYLSGVFVLRFY